MESYTYICNMKPIEEKIEKMTKKSRTSIKTIILFYNFLKKINTEIFYFSLILVLVLVGGYFLGNNIYLTLITHFLIWFLFSEKYFNKLDMEKENVKIDYITTSLEYHLDKTKKGVK